MKFHFGAKNVWDFNNARFSHLLDRFSLLFSSFRHMQFFVGGTILDNDWLVNVAKRTVNCIHQDVTTVGGNYFM